MRALPGAGRTRLTPELLEEARADLDRRTLGHFKRTKRSTKGWNGPVRLCRARDTKGGKWCKAPALAGFRCRRHYFRDRRRRQADALKASRRGNRRHVYAEGSRKGLPDVCKCGRGVVKALERCNPCLQRFYRTHPCRCVHCGARCRDPGRRFKPICPSCKGARRPDYGRCTGDGCRRRAAYPNGECRACRAWREVREGRRELCPCGRAPAVWKGRCSPCGLREYEKTPRGRSVKRRSQRARRRRDRALSAVPRAA